MTLIKNEREFTQVIKSNHKLSFRLSLEREWPRTMVVLVHLFIVIIDFKEPRQELRRPIVRVLVPHSLQVLTDV